MGATFLFHTNNLLRRVNEVELNAASFASARGMQAIAKDCVLDSIAAINQQKWEWPFHAIQHQQPLQVAENEYSWPIDFKSVDWDSFQIVNDGTFATNSKHLEPINRSQWYTYYRDMDNDAPNGLRVPDAVFRAHGNGFGVTPVPDKTYTISFRYFKTPEILVNQDDVTSIPEDYNNVILWGALYHMNLFRENVEGADRAQKNFDDGIENMYNILIEKNAEDLVDTRINYGGQPYFNSGGYHL